MGNTIVNVVGYGMEWPVENGIVRIDSFYCPACGWNGRVSGAWVAHQLDRAAR